MYNQYYNILRTFATGRIELIRFVALTGFRVALKIWWCLRSTLQTNNENNPINHLSSIKNPETMGLRGRFVRGYFHFFFAVTWCNSPIHTFIYIHIYIWYLFVRHETCWLYDTAQLSQSRIVLISATTCNIRKGADRMLDYQEFLFLSLITVQCSTFKSWISLSTLTPSQNPTSRLEFEKT